MLTITKRNAQTSYNLIHILYWTVYGFMLGFSSVYLLEQGFTNAQIGVVLGCAYLFSTLMQPAIASAFERTGVNLMHGVAYLYIGLMAVAVCMFFLPLPKFLLAAGLVICLGLESAIQPSVNTMLQMYEAAGFPVRFGTARGFGSFVYALVVAIMGRVLESISPIYLPLFYLGGSVVLCAYLLLVKIPEGEISARPKASKETSAMALCSQPWFLLLMGATAFLALNALLVGSYMIQIMYEIGGGSTEQGIAVAIAAAMEFPAMLVYASIAKKYTDRRMMVLCGWVWAFKCGLIAIAQSPYFIFAAQILQFAGYGFFVPANVRYIRELLPESAFLKAQSLTGSAFTAGTLIAVVGGGALLDAVGVRNTLYIGECFSLLGAVMLTLSVITARRVRLDK